MNYTVRKSVRAQFLILVAALLLASTAVWAQTAMPMTATTSAPKAEMQSSMMGSPDMKQSMKAGMDDMQKMQMSGDTDKDFAMMMRMHHQQALDMADMELAHGKSTELKAMAKRIISGQKKEIAQFDQWLTKKK
nr:DUF305 domain-containing protein [Rhodoferax sp.]